MMAGCGDDNTGPLKPGRMSVCAIETDSNCVNVNLLLFTITQAALKMSLTHRCPQLYMKRITISVNICPSGQIWVVPSIRTCFR